MVFDIWKTTFRSTGLGDGLYSSWLDWSFLEKLYSSSSKSWNVKKQWNKNHVLKICFKTRKLLPRCRSFSTFLLFCTAFWNSWLNQTEIRIRQGAFWSSISDTNNLKLLGMKFYFCSTFFRGVVFSEATLGWLKSLSKTASWLRTWLPGSPFKFSSWIWRSTSDFAKRDFFWQLSNGRRFNTAGSVSSESSAEYDDRWTSWKCENSVFVITGVVP